MRLDEKNFLIAYYSRKGNNYVSGIIVNLSKGNTSVIAEMIEEITAGDLFQIETVNAYSKDYTICTEEAQGEKQAHARPKLTDHIDNINKYDVIFLGYPNWWGTMPMAVWAFLKEYDFSGKTSIPFCTHEGSGMGVSENDINKICPNSTVLKGLAIKGSNVNKAKNDIKNWIERL